MGSPILVNAPSPVMQAAIEARLSADFGELLTARTPGEVVRLALAAKPRAVIIAVDGAGAAARECEMLRALGSFALVAVWDAVASDVVTACLDAGTDGAVWLRSPHFTRQIGAILQRCGVQQQADREQIYTIDDLVIDESAHTVTRGGRGVNLTPLEFRLLVVLARKIGVVVPTKEILARVWGPEYENDTQYVRLYMGYLRNKLERDPQAAPILFTQWGIGYRLGGGDDRRDPDRGDAFRQASA